MRIAGRLASEVLDFITPHVKPGVTTGKLNDLCHDYMVEVQHTVPHAISLYGRLFDEGTILTLGRALEAAFGVAGRRPPTG